LTVLTRLTEFMERSQELKETVKSALIYPTILVVVAVLSVMVLLIFVVPQFSQMFEESGRPCPCRPRSSSALGEFLNRTIGGLMLLGGYALFFLMAPANANPESRYRWDERFLRCPCRRHDRQASKSRAFRVPWEPCSTMACLLLAALGIVKETLTATASWRKSSMMSSPNCARAPAWVVRCKRPGCFPEWPCRWSWSARKPAALQEMLIQVADVFDREVQPPSSACSPCWSRCMILGSALVIGGIIMSILLAILSVNELALYNPAPTGAIHGETSMNTRQRRVHGFYAHRTARGARHPRPACGDGRAEACMGKLGGAKSDTAKLQIEEFGSSLDLYRLEVGRYPDHRRGSEGLVQAPAGATGWNGPT
jgi:general secretion pathway protein F